MMHVSWALFWIFHLVRFSITAAVRVVNETGVLSSIDDCSFPGRTFSTIKNQFGLTAFTDEGDETWPVPFSAPYAIGQPSLGRPWPPEFTLNLTGSRLTLQEAKVFFYPIFIQPRNLNRLLVDDATGIPYRNETRFQTVPPVLEELTIVDGIGKPTPFWAICTADAKKNPLFELKSILRTCHDTVRNFL